MTPPQTVLGAGTVSSEYGNDEQQKAFLDTCKDYGVKSIDTAYLYGDSEEVLGRLQAPSSFSIDTKHPGGNSPFIGGDPATKQNVIEIAKKSLDRLQTKQVDVYYLHAPDHRVPFEETLDGINEVYKSGAFRRFGLSNFTAADVEEVIRIAKEKGYVLPTVFQGSYNAVQRPVETDLLPVLRKHGIAFYAYSPSAGGFLAKTPKQFENGGGEGRWSRTNPLGHMYHSMYTDKPAVLEALGTWNEIAAAEGITGIEMAYRWIFYHSALDGDHGDGVIFGARGIEQLQATLNGIRKGPLSDNAAAKIEKIWESVKSVSHLDNFNGYLKQTFKAMEQGNDAAKE